jgi:hypothetical protein
MNQTNDAPTPPDYQTLLVGVARELDNIFNGALRADQHHTGFVLMVFPFGDNPGAHCNFISNGADREDVVRLMRGLIARFEGSPHEPGHA